MPDPKPGEAAFFAVIIDDSQVFGQAGAMEAERCSLASGPMFAHGADIDAVGLFRGDELLGYLDAVDYREGGLCGSERANTMTDATRAKGAPDARVDSGFVSLGGGYLIGEFEPWTEIAAGDVVVVYEVGRLCGSDRRCDGRNEGYEVFVAEDLDCTNFGNGYPYSQCAVAVGEGLMGESRIEVPAF